MPVVEATQESCLNCVEGNAADRRVGQSCSAATRRHSRMPLDHWSCCVSSKKVKPTGSPAPPPCFIGCPSCSPHSAEAGHPPCMSCARKTWTTPEKLRRAGFESLDSLEPDASPFPLRNRDFPGAEITTSLVPRSTHRTCLSCVRRSVTKRSRAVEATSFFPGLHKSHTVTRPSWLNRKRI